MEFGPLAELASRAGPEAIMMAIIALVILAIVRGHLEPRNTSKRVEEVLEKRYETLKEAFDASERVREHSLAVSEESLTLQRAGLKILEDLHEHKAREEAAEKKIE